MVPQSGEARGGAVGTRERPRSRADHGGSRARAHTRRPSIGGDTMRDLSAPARVIADDFSAPWRYGQAWRGGGQNRHVRGRARSYVWARTHLHVQWLGSGVGGWQQGKEERTKVVQSRRERKNEEPCGSPPTSQTHLGDRAAWRNVTGRGSVTRRNKSDDWFRVGGCTTVVTLAHRQDGSNLVGRSWR